MFTSLVGTRSGRVRALEEELVYYRKLAKEQEEIIQQLHRGFSIPGDVVYIHPADFAVMVNNMSVSTVFSMFQLDAGQVPDYHEIKGIRYKESASMPKYTKEIQ